MKQDLTDITLVVDRSGSMQAICSDAEGGINAFVKKQKDEKGEAVFSLVQFDTEYEFVHSGIPIKDVPKYQLIPRGATALLDAVGRAINTAGERLAALPEEERPGLVVFVIVTDGHENSSKEFTRDAVKKLIEEQRSAYKWQFVFLGADEKAFDQAASIGITQDSAGIYKGQHVNSAYLSASSNVSRGRASAAAGQSVSMSFTAEERKHMKTGESKK